MLITQSKYHQDGGETLIADVMKATGWSYNTLQNMRTDADNNALFSQRVLEQVEADIVRQESPDNWANTRIPTRVDLPLGLQKDTKIYSQFSGRPKFVNSNTKGVEYVNFTLDEESQTVGEYELAYEYTDRELRSVAVANQSELFPTAFDLAQEKYMATVQLMDEFDHILACFGDRANKLNGFLSHPDVTALDQVGTFDPYAGGTTAQELYDWIVNTIRKTIRTATNQTSRPNWLAMPEDLYLTMTSKFFSGTAISAMDKLRVDMAGLGIDIIDPVVELRAADLELYGAESAGANRDRLVLGRLDRTVLDRRISGIVPSRWDIDKNGMSRKLIQAARSVRFIKPQQFVYVRFTKMS